MRMPLAQFALYVVCAIPLPFVCPQLFFLKNQKVMLTETAQGRLLSNCSIRVLYI